jgi:hypothetical protein
MANAAAAAGGTVGVVAFDPETHLYRFLVRTNNNRWRVNNSIPERVRNGSMRFYGFGDLFAVVSDDGLVTRFGPLYDNDLQSAVTDPAIGGQGLSWDHIRPLGPGGDPAEQDRIFREDRDRLLAFAAPAAGGQPPPPPGGGAVAAAGAESQAGRAATAQDQQPALAALAALAAWPAEGAAPALRPRPIGVWELAAQAAAPPPAEDLSDDLRSYHHLLQVVRDMLATNPAVAALPVRARPPRDPFGLNQWLRLDIPEQLEIIDTPDLWAPRAADRPRAAAPAAAIKPPLTHVSEAVLERAVRNKETCPISLEEINLETGACVAPCYHAFQKEAIQQWMVEHSTCPQCRQACCL